MNVVNFILNVIALMLWLSFRSSSFDPLAQTSVVSLAGALKRAEPRRFGHWHFLGLLAALLLLRAFVYWQIGSRMGWVPKLDLRAICIFFRSDLFRLALLFSCLSFLGTLFLFYFFLLLLSIVNGRTADIDPVQRMVRLHLGPIDSWPRLVKLVLPLIAVTLFWVAVSPLLISINVITPVLSARHRWEEALIIGIGAYLSWKYLIGGLLFLGLISTYVYLGTNSFWNFIAMTARNLLTPLRKLPLIIGKFDFAPLVVIAVVFFAAEQVEHGLTKLYAKLPL